MLFEYMWGEARGTGRGPLELGRPSLGYMKETLHDCTFSKKSDPQKCNVNITVLLKWR